MPDTPPPGIRIAYDTTGDLSDPVIVVIPALGRQLIDWDGELCDRLAAGGTCVVRMDNRDVGLSDRVEAGKVNLARLAAARRAGEPLAVPYTLEDMAGDVVRVLDDLAVRRAHIAGISMGGRIAQLVAIGYPDRAASLISIASTSGAHGIDAATEHATRALFAAPPRNRTGAIEAQLEARRALAAPGTFDAAWERPRVAAEFDRAFDPAGVGRQLAAVMADTDRTGALGALATPTLVIHGAEDPLVAPSAGRATAAAIPGARYLEIGGLGHDLPPRVWPLVVPAILQHIHA